MNKIILKHLHLAFLAVFACVTAVAQTAVEKPNILWIVSEDNSPFIGAYGDQAATTPNIDALAARGILYENAYCTAPVCAPSRFTLITGYTLRLLAQKTCGANIRCQDS